MADKPQHPPTIDLDGARLRPLRVADADGLYAYLRDPVVTELTSYPCVSHPTDYGFSLPESFNEANSGNLFLIGIV